MCTQVFYSSPPPPKKKSPHAVKVHVLNAFYSVKR